MPGLERALEYSLSRLKRRPFFPETRKFFFAGTQFSL
jgi:hypothetical protein